MAVASLNNYTVPLAGDTPSQGLLMPKLKYRFRILFRSFGTSAASDLTELTKQVVDFTKPSVDWEEQVIDIYNSKIKYAGKYTWGDCTINLRDDAQGWVSRMVAEQVQKQFDFMEQSSARSGADYKFTTVCEILDGGNGEVTPTVLETWELYGCFIKSVNYNDINYGDAAPQTIALTLGFDNAHQLPVSGSPGSAVGGIGSAVGQATLGRTDITTAGGQGGAG